MPTDILTQPAAPRVRISSNQSTRVAETTHTATGPPQIEKSQRSKIVNPKTASVSEKIADKRAERLERCPTSARSLLARCWSKKASPRQAIKAFCHECLLATQHVKTLGHHLHLQCIKANLSQPGVAQ